MRRHCPESKYRSHWKPPLCNFSTILGHLGEVILERWVGASQPEQGGQDRSGSSWQSIHVQQPGYRGRTGCSEWLKHRVCTCETELGKMKSGEREAGVQIPEWAGDRCLTQSWRRHCRWEAIDRAQVAESHVWCSDFKSLSFSVRERELAECEGCRWAVSYRISTRVELKNEGLRSQR